MKEVGFQCNLCMCSDNNILTTGHTTCLDMISVFYVKNPVVLYRHIEAINTVNATFMYFKQTVLLQQHVSTDLGHLQAFYHHKK